MQTAAFIGRDDLVGRASAVAKAIADRLPDAATSRFFRPISLRLGVLALFFLANGPHPRICWWTERAGRGILMASR